MSASVCIFMPVEVSMCGPASGSQIVTLTVCVCVNDDDCFDCHSWRNKIVIAFETLSSFLTKLHMVSGIVCIVCPFADDEFLKNIHVDLALLV